MPRPLDEFLHVEVAVPERGCGFRLRRREQPGKLLSAADHAHAPTATTGRCFDNHGKADLLCVRERLAVTGYDILRTGQNGHARTLHGLPSFLLLAHQPGYLWRRANELDATRLGHLGKIG